MYDGDKNEYVTDVWRWQDWMCDGCMTVTRLNQSFIFRITLETLKSLNEWNLSLKTSLKFTPHFPLFLLSELLRNLLNFRGSHPVVFLGKGVLEICSTCEPKD